MSYAKIALVALLLLGVCCKYSSDPEYNFNGFSSLSGVPMFMELSRDSERLAVYTNSSTYYGQNLFNLEGSKQCNSTVNFTLLPLGFPSQTNSLFLDAFSGRFLKMSSPCSNPVTVTTLANNTVDFVIGSTEEEGFLALAQSNRIVEYSIGSGAITKTYALNSGQSYAFARYSEERDTLWVGVKYGSTGRLVSYDTSSGQRINEITVSTSIVFIKGNNDGDSFIGASSNYIYRVGKDGSANRIRKFLLNLVTLNTNTEIPLSVCTNDDVVLTLSASLSSGYTLNVYDSEDGSSIQNLPLSFVPDQFKSSEQIVDCTNKYLLFVDIQGYFQVFKYSKPFPVWAIILIVVGGLLIIGGGVGFFIWRKKKMQRQQQAGYQQFNNQQY